MARKAQNTPLTVADILQWADAHHQRTGTYPKTNTGPVIDGPLGTTWRQIDNALRLGLRTLPGGSSLAQLLDAERGVRNVQALPPLDAGQVVRWARAHRRRTGKLPTENSGRVADARGEVWGNLDQALREGLRSLPGGDTLPRLLARLLNARNRTTLPNLTEEIILGWCDWHKKTHDRWPSRKSGPIWIARAENWLAVDDALRQGCRGLPGGSSLARLLAKHRSVRNKAALPRLTKAIIRKWARLHQGRTGRLPTADSGPVIDAPGETWNAVNLALWQG